MASTGFARHAPIRYFSTCSPMLRPSANEEKELLSASELVRWLIEECGSLSDVLSEHGEQDHLVDKNPDDTANEHGNTAVPTGPDAPVAQNPPRSRAKRPYTDADRTRDRTARALKTAQLAVHEVEYQIAESELRSRLRSYNARIAVRHGIPPGDPAVYPLLPARVRELMAISDAAVAKYESFDKDVKFRGWWWAQ